MVMAGKYFWDLNDWSTLFGLLAQLDHVSFSLFIIETAKFDTLPIIEIEKKCKLELKCHNFKICLMKLSSKC